jgi:hypothetical protein
VHNFGLNKGASAVLTRAVSVAAVGLSSASGLIDTAVFGATPPVTLGVNTTLNFSGVAEPAVYVVVSGVAISCTVVLMVRMSTMLQSLLARAPEAATPLASQPKAPVGGLPLWYHRFVSAGHRGHLKEMYRFTASVATTFTVQVGTAFVSAESACKGSVERSQQQQQQR